MAKEVRKKGFSFLSFLLGILIGIILIVGAVGGVVAYVLYADVDKVLSTAGLDNSKDEKGVNKYINTDTETGVKNMLELVTKVYSYATDFQNKSLGELETLVPAVSGLSDKLTDGLGKYVTLDKAELKATTFGQLPNYFQDVVYDIQPASFIDSGDLENNKILSVVLLGTEADYVSANGTRYPVWRAAAQTAAQPEEQPAAKSAEPEYTYFYEDADKNRFIVLKNQNGGYSATTTAYADYNEETAELTGNYYYPNGDSSAEKVTPKPVTLRTLVDDNPVDKIDIPGVIEVAPTNELMTYIGYSISNVNPNGDGTYKGTYEKADGKTVDCIMETDGNGYISRAYYLDGDSQVEIKGNKINDISSVVDEVNVSVFMDVKASDAIMTYIGYGIISLEENAGEGYTHVGKIKIEKLSASASLAAEPAEGEAPAEGGTPAEQPEQPSSYEWVDCFVQTEGDKIVSAYYLNEQGEKVAIASTTTKQIGKRVENITTDLKIKDVVKIDEDDKVMKKFGERSIKDAGSAVNDLNLDDFMDVTLNVQNNKLKSDSAILSYIVYGLTDVDVVNLTATFNPADGGEKVTVSFELDPSNKIISVTKAGGEPVPGTPVNNVSSRVSGVTKDLKIGQLLDVEGNKILTCLEDSTIETLADDIGTLTINELYADEIYGTAPWLKAVSENAQAGEVVFDGTFTYYTKEGERYVIVGDDGKLTAEEFSAGVAGGKVYYTHGTLEEKTRWYEAVKENAGENQIVYNPAYLYYVINADGDYELYNKTGRLTLSELEQGGTYYTHGSPNALWKLLLYNYTVSGSDVDRSTGYEATYTVNNIGDMINNVTVNIRSSTLAELDEAEVLIFNAGDLEKKVTLPNGSEVVLGTLKLSEAIGILVGSAHN